MCITSSRSLRESLRTDMLTPPEKVRVRRSDIHLPPFREALWHCQRFILKPPPFFAGNVYFDVGSVGDRYGKFGEGSDSPGEPGETSLLTLLI